jgi:hypothetical protein
VPAQTALATTVPLVCGDTGHGVARLTCRKSPWQAAEMQNQIPHLNQTKPADKKTVPLKFIFSSGLPLNRTGNKTLQKA